MSNTRKPLMAGNWKMNLDHRQAAHLIQQLDWALKDAKHDYDAVEVAVMPPFTDLRTVQTLVEGDNLKIRYGAQDLSQFDSGAYTGEISGEMLGELGCAYVLVGHSERRQHHLESDELLNAKVKAALRHGLTPILCVGEAIEVRRAGTHVEFVLDQLEGGVEDLPAEAVRTMVIAYEPVWAIGTGEVATPNDAQVVCNGIRERLRHLYDDETADSVRILYGGSVKGGNVVEIMGQEDIDGALVGGASLKADDFVPICTYQQAGA